MSKGRTETVSKPILKLDDVNKAFGGIVTADHVSFELYPGEILGLIGPNGAGKSTMLNLISGIYQVDSGKIFFDGQDITKMPSHKRARSGIGRTFQTPRFLYRSTARENMLLGTDLAEQMGYWNSFVGKKGIDFEKECKELLELAGLKIQWDEQIEDLPFGQQKLLEIVRALLSHPKCMLVDEPAAGLNTQETGIVSDILQYATQKGIAVLLIEHQMDMVMSTCDRIVVLNFGKLIAEGKPEEIATNPEVIEAYLGGDFNA